MDDNPYQSPKTQSPPAPKRGSGGRLVFGILLLVGMVPASAIAFFCCCLAGMAAVEQPAGAETDATITTGMLAGSVGAVLAFGLMLWGGIRMIQRPRQLPSA